MKKYLSVLLVLISVFMLTACGTETNANDQLFQEEDFEITMDKGFTKKTLAGIKYYYQNDELGIGVTVNNESKQLFDNAGVEFPDDVKGYANFVVSANGLKDTKVTDKGKYAQFNYTKSVNGKEYYYYGTTHKSGDTYWMINFFCVSGKAEEYQKTFERMAESIKVK